MIHAPCTTDVNYLTQSGMQLLTGIGMTFFFMPMTALILSDLQSNDVAKGAGLAIFFQVPSGFFASSLTA